MKTSIIDDVAFAVACTSTACMEDYLAESMDETAKVWSKNVRELQKVRSVSQITIQFDRAQSTFVTAGEALMINHKTALNHPA